MKKTAIIPAFNEEKTVSDVLATILRSKLFDKIIVVNDGSTDNTLKNINKFSQHNLEIINLNENKGKGGAVRIAINNINEGVIAFFDADLIGLKKEHIYSILNPVLNKEADMCVGLIETITHKSIYSKLLLSGIRTIKAEIFNEIKESPLIAGFGLESVMNDYCKKNNLKIKTTFLDGVKHVYQIKKRGLKFHLNEINEVAKTKIALIGKKEEIKEYGKSK